MSRNEPEIRTKSDRPLRLGQLLFDRASGELRDTEDRVVELRRQSSEVLSALARRPMETVRKEDLIEAIWGNLAVTDDSLVQCIADIRRTLGPEGRDCIRTVRRRGYRLVPTEDGLDFDIEISASSRRATLSTPSVLFLFATAVLAAGLAVHAYFTPRNTPWQSSHNVPVVAVLPFANANDEPEQQYFIDGLTEDLATDLSRISGLRLISSASSFAFRDSDATPTEIAKDLGASFVVTGTVRRDNRRLRVNANLTDVMSGENIWADRYDRDIGGVFDLQDDVSRAITSALAIELTSSEEALFDRQQRIDADAYDLVLRGLSPLRTFTDEGIEEARRYFVRAVAIDPNYARAHANLALTYGTSIIFRLGDNTALDPVAVKEAELAVELDPKLPQAQFALAVVRLSERDFDDAIAAASEAVRLDPNYADGYAVLAQTLAFGGDKSEALSAIRTAKLLSPRHTFAYLWVEGHILFQQRRYQEARTILEEVVDRNPAFLLGQLTLAATYGHLGLAEEADWIAFELLTLSPDLSAFEDGQSAPYREEEDRAHYIEGLLLAGLPD